GNAAAGQRADAIGSQINAAYAVVVGVGDIQELAVQRQRQTCGRIEANVRPETVSKPRHAVADKRFDRAVAYAANRMIGGVGDVYRAIRSNHHIVGQAESRAVDQRAVAEAVRADLRAVEGLLFFGTVNQPEAAGKSVYGDRAAGAANTA